MDVTSTKAATPGATAKTSATKEEETDGATSALTGDFDTFLKLLTTQMKNQDPLQPMESTEFVAQLAAFSSVEQQIGSNTRLDSILDALAGTGADGYAAWIGKEVLAPASASFTGDPIEITVTPKDDADSAQLVVKNDFGQVVDRQTVVPTSRAVTWDGTDSLGAPVANGLYSFSLESYSGETLLDTQQGQVYAKVSEVRLDDEGPRGWSSKAASRWRRATSPGSADGAKRSIRIEPLLRGVEQGGQRAGAAKIGMDPPDQPAIGLPHLLDTGPGCEAEYAIGVGVGHMACVGGRRSGLALRSGLRGVAPTFQIGDEQGEAVAVPRRVEGRHQRLDLGEREGGKAPAGEGSGEHLAIHLAAVMIEAHRQRRAARLARRPARRARDRRPATPEPVGEQRDGHGERHLAQQQQAGGDGKDQRRQRPFPRKPAEQHGDQREGDRRRQNPGGEVHDPRSASRRRAAPPSAFSSAARPPAA